MKRFRFTLRSVTVLRTHREMQALDAFGRAVHQYVQAEEQLAAIRARQAALEAALFAGRRERFDAAHEAQSLAAYRGECVEEGTTERLMLAARAAMGARRTEYVEAHRQLKVVEHLEAKRRLAHRQEAARLEQVEFDGSAGRALHRKPTAVC